MRPSLIVSVHDVAPSSATASKTWAELMAPLGVPLTLLVVPGPWQGSRFGDPGDDGQDLADWLRGRQSKGDEIAVHGWCHRADVPGPLPRRLVGNAVARGAAEYWALDRATSRERTEAGLGLLSDAGLQVTGTTPPGWLASRQAIRGYADAGLGYTTDHAGLRDLHSGRRYWAPAFCHRPGDADAAEPPRSEVMGRKVVDGAARLIRAGLPVRIGLHPNDLKRPGLDDSAVRSVRRCLEAGAVPATYAEMADRVRTTSGRNARADRNVELP